MHISLITPQKRLLLDEQSTSIRVNSPFAILEIVPEKGETCKVSGNEAETPFQEGVITYHIDLGTRNTDDVKIWCNNELFNIHFTCTYGSVLDEDVVQNLMNFYARLSELKSNGDNILLNDFLSAVDKGRLSLLCVQEPLTGYDDNSLLDKLEKELKQKIRSICSSPKQGTMIDELVQDVSLVKRINSNTLMHLASHSEHWKSRTLIGLVPKRLKADIIEDEINIYENLFFKMAIDDISTYVSRQILSIKHAYKSNQNAIDWEYYGMQVNDYQRNELISRLMHISSTDTLSTQNEVYSKVLNCWNRVSKILMTIRSSAFYKSIDGKRRISKNVHLTNILKNDQRYKSLYDLWCLIRKAIQTENNESHLGLSYDTNQQVRHYYTVYSFMASLYAMHVNGLSFSENSIIRVDDNDILVKALAIDTCFKYNISNQVNDFGYSSLCIGIVENMDIAFDVPEVFDLNPSLFDDFANVAMYTTKDNKLHLFKKPDSMEKNSLYGILKRSAAERYKMTKAEKNKATQIYTQWWKWVDEICMDARMHERYSRDLSLVPIFFDIASDPLSISKVTEDLFQSARDYTYYLLPCRFENYINIKQSRLLRYLFNYGEAFDYEDKDEWKNYKRGVLPVTQTDIGSIQRLIKLFSLHKSLLIMELEDDQPQHCPVCGCSAEMIKRIDSSTWECCNSGECGIRWGKTKCTKGCGEFFYWIQPKSSFDNNEFDCESECDLIAKKDSMLDKFMITDFEFEKTSDGNLTLDPICPKCGARRFNRELLDEAEDIKE